MTRMSSPGVPADGGPCPPAPGGIGGGAWLEVFQVGGLQEAALGVGKSQEEACLVEEAQTPVMIPQGWEQRVEGVHLQTADVGDQPGRVGSGLPEVVQLRSHGAHPWSPS